MHVSMTVYVSYLRYSEVTFEYMFAKYINLINISIIK